MKHIATIRRTLAASVICAASATVQSIAALPEGPNPTKPMTITSPAIDNGAIIPDRFSPNDANHSPALDFLDVPPQARSLVLIMDDPDSPHGVFTHWVVFNIDPSFAGFRENQVPPSSKIGRNSYGKAEYDGPKPPNGEHRYFFRLYALDTRLGLGQGATRADVEHAMENHVIAKAELTGRYATPMPER